MPRTELMIKNHICDLKVNERLQNAERWIRQRITFTGLEMTQAGISASPRDLIRSLRMNGMDIVLEREISKSGARISRWTLM